MGKKKNEKQADVAVLSPLEGEEEEGFVHRLPRKIYDAELVRLQIELVKLAAWVKHKGLRVVVLFEGRDAAGKGGAIMRITEAISPRLCRVVALAAPTERERTQWYFQRYVEHLPAAGEIVLFDRSWYNRAGVEHVMGFCSADEYEEFLRSAPEFERLLTRSGIVLVKYWFSVSDQAQEKRFQERNHSPIKRWKLSPMDLASRERWVDYSKAKDAMFKYTDLPDSPWWVVAADDKRRARLNCVSHLLNCISYKELTHEPVSFSKQQKPDPKYVRPPLSSMRWIPNHYPESP